MISCVLSGLVRIYFSVDSKTFLFGNRQKTECTDLLDFLSSNRGGKCEW